MTKFLASLFAAFWVLLSVPVGAGQKAQGVERAASGKIKRDPQARYSFRKANPCPATNKIAGACPGYVIDHLLPLKRGGSDSPSNMQWQTIEAAKEKDKWE